jgi:hypothetical protein
VKEQQVGAVQSSAEFGAETESLSGEAMAWLSLAHDSSFTSSLASAGTSNLSAAVPENNFMSRLVKVAEDELRRRRMRSRFLPSELFGEGAWSMLLDLFICEQRGRMVSTTSVCIASDVPATTALRWLDLLESKGLIERSAANRDKRVRYVSLTDRARESLCALLNRQGTDLR